MQLASLARCPFDPGAANSTALLGASLARAQLRGKAVRIGRGRATVIWEDSQHLPLAPGLGRRCEAVRTGEHPRARTSPEQPNLQQLFADESSAATDRRLGVLCMREGSEVLMRSARVSAFSLPASFPLAPFLLALAAGIALLQALPHPAGVSPAGAVALLCGALLRSRAHALGASLAISVAASAGVGIARGDLAIAFHALTPALLAGWLATAAIGASLRDRRSAPRVAGASVSGSLAFFLITNFAVWAQLGTYSADASGLLTCYAAGLPFLARALAGDLAYSAALFGGLAWAERRSRSRVRAARTA
jgi:hypothetical protein